MTSANTRQIVINPVSIPTSPHSNHLIPLELFMRTKNCGQMAASFLKVVLFLSALLFSLSFSLLSPQVMRMPTSNGNGQFVLPEYDIKAVNVTIPIKWFGVVNASKSDVVIVNTIPKTYDQRNLPAPEGYEYKTVLGFYKVYELDSQLTGSGEIEVPIYASVDKNFYFEYVRFDPTRDMAKTILFWSKPLSTTQKCFAFHTARGHNQTEYKITYSSTETTPHFVHVTQSYQDISKDVFSPLNGTTSHFAFAPTSSNPTYTIEEMKAAPANQTHAWVNPGYFHVGTIAIPKAGDYYYRVRSIGDGTALSRPFILTAGGANLDTEVFIFGDSGVGLNFYTETDQQQTATLTYKAIQQLINLQQSISTTISILHIGDLSYSRGWGFLNEYFFQQIEPLASRYPYHISIGNHEMCFVGQSWRPDWHTCGNDSGGEAGIPTFRRYLMPPSFCSSQTGQCIEDEQTAEYNKLGMRNIAYSYDVNHIHFVVFTLELDFTERSAQYKFLVQDLSTIDRKRTPWVVLSAHRPFYCSTTGCAITPDIPADQSKSMDIIQRRLLQPLMVKYRVDIGIWGHTHQYERYKPMLLADYVPVENFIDPQTSLLTPVTRVVDGIQYIKAVAPIHIVSGAAGNEYNPPWATYMKKVTDYSANHHQTPDHVVFRTMNFGFSHFRANATHLTGKWFSNQEVTVHDHFVIEKVPGF